MDPSSGFSMIIVVLFSCGFSILYWRVWARMLKCLKTCFKRERLWGIVKAPCRYVCQLPRRAYYAFYKRQGISVFFAEMFPDDTDSNFEDVENQVIHDHDPEVLPPNHDFHEPPIELIPVPGVGHRSTSSVYSSHPDLQQAEVYPPAPSANSREIKEDVLLSDDDDKRFHDSWVDKWVDATFEDLATHFEEITETAPAE